MASFSPFPCDSLHPLQYDDLLSQFSNMQVTPAQEGSSPSPAPGPAPTPAPAPIYNTTLSVDQFIHDLDSNSMELDLLFSDEEKRLLLDKQCAVNPWYLNKLTFSPFFLWFSFFFCQFHFKKNKIQTSCDLVPPLMWFFPRINVFQAPVCREQSYFEDGSRRQTQGNGRNSHSLEGHYFDAPN